MRMRNGNHNDGVAFESVEQGVREVGEDASSNAGLDFRCNEGISGDQTYSTIQFVEELDALTGTLFLEPEICVIYLLVSECEEPNFHLT